MDLTVRSENLTSGSQEWLGSAHGTNAAQTVTLDKSSFTGGTHYPDGFLKAGLPLARLAATGKFVLYNSAGAGGAEIFRGFLLTDVSVPTEDIDPQGPVIDTGIVLVSKLPVAFTPPAAAANGLGLTSFTFRP